MADALGVDFFAVADALNEAPQALGGLGLRLRAGQHAACTEIDVVAEHVERLLIAGQLQDGRDGRAADVAAARIEQNEVAAAGDLVQKAGRVAAEEEGGLGLVVRNDVQQPEAGVLRPLRDLQNALNPAAAHFHDGAHALFLDRRQATDEVAR